MAHAIQQEESASRVSVSSVDARTILTHSSGFVRRYKFTLNPYTGCAFGCEYCYARFFVADADRRNAWGNWLSAKRNAAQLVARACTSGELSTGDAIYMSTVTDPYQPVERRLRLTRAVLETLLEHGVQPRLTIQTRSPLATRDIDLFRQFERIRVNFTMPAAATATPSATAARSTATPSPALTASPTADPQPLSWNVRVGRLTIPALGIDSEVSGSLTVPDTSTPPPGCPAPPAGQETLTVPAEGIATPEEAFEGIENKAWIFGHSRWQSQPGLFHVLQDIDIGDELLIDGVDRRTGEQVIRQRFVVEGIYLTDKGSGAELLTADDPAEIPAVPTVVLQTSVREAGANKHWLLDRERVLTRATNLVEADLEDPCKYLLLFVIARASEERP